VTETGVVVATAPAYFEGWFDGDLARMDRVLHPNFVKRRGGEELGITTKERMLELTRRGEGKEDAPDRNLVRTSAGWKIANALWQPT